MSNNQVHFATLDGSQKGRSSHYFGDIKHAGTVCDTQNDRAKKLGIKARYAVVTMPAKDMPAGEKIKTL